jgi:hypothetical protein
MNAKMPLFEFVSIDNQAQTQLTKADGTMQNILVQWIEHFEEY